MADAGRVVAGEARGTRLLAAGPATRPLTERVKQALFATLEAGSLAPWPAPFLDLFAGSGAGGIEALSRGAPRAVFVERDRATCRVIEANLGRTTLADRGRVVVADVPGFLAGAALAAGGPFGAVLLDPPYGDGTLGLALERLADPARAWLQEEVVVVAKHFWRDAPADRFGVRGPDGRGGLIRQRERRFGETQLTFYTWAA